MTDFIPVLSEGTHASPSEGACIMEMVSFLAGEEWSDSPECSFETITLIAQFVNDSLPDEERGRILSQFNRLFDTAGIEKDHSKLVRFAGLLDTYCASVPSAYSYQRIDGYLRMSDKLYEMRHYMYNWLTELLAKDDWEGMVKVLSDVLDIADEVLGRTDVEQQDLSILAKVMA